MLCFSEILFERKDFPERELAALVASKVYYHLGAFNESLTFALGAGQRLDVNASSEYIETIICKRRELSRVECLVPEYPSPCS